MPDRITFTGAVLLGFSRKKEGTAQFAASLTQSVAKQLNWGDIPDYMTGAELEGDLHATLLQLTPQEKELAKHVLELDVSRVHKFEALRLELEGKNGKGYRNELRFQANFADPKGARKLEEYMLTIGEGKGKLVVSYTKQESLPLADEQSTSDYPAATKEQMEALAEED